MNPISASNSMPSVNPYLSGINTTASTGTDMSDVSLSGDKDTEKKSGYRSSPVDCETCKHRKYQDGSNESVSYKSPAHISPDAAASAVRAHEGEHVSNAFSKAQTQGGKVVSVGVTLQSAICPECGRVYVSGGETNTVIKYDSQQSQTNPYTQNKEALNNMYNSGGTINSAV